MITGVMQSWKTPVVEADVDWIDLQKNNRDMEYSSWMEYLIKLSCAIYSIDPSEIGWDISRSSGNGGLFEGSQEQRLKHSKDKGLYPLLKFLQRKINKYIIEQINPDFELVFVGLNGLTIEEELDMDIKKVGSFMTVNEAREKYEMKPLEFGDVPTNATLIQNKNAEMMAKQGGQGMEMDDNGNIKPSSEKKGEEPDAEEEDEEQNPFDLYAEENDEEDTNKGGLRETFVKAFDNFLNNEENGSN